MREQTKYLLEILYEVFFYLTQLLHSETQILIGRVEVFLEKGVLKIYRKFTAEHQCQSEISIKLQSNFIEIALRHGYYPVNFLHIFRPPFPRTPLGGCFCRVQDSPQINHCVISVQIRSYFWSVFSRIRTDVK